MDLRPVRHCRDHPSEEEFRRSFAGYLTDDPCALRLGDRLVPPFGRGTLPIVLRLASTVAHPPFGCINNVSEHFAFSSLAVDGEVVNEG